MVSQSHKWPAAAEPLVKLEQAADCDTMPAQDEPSPPQTPQRRGRCHHSRSAADAVQHSRTAPGPRTRHRSVPLHNRRCRRNAIGISVHLSHRKHHISRMLPSQSHAAIGNAVAHTPHSSFWAQGRCHRSRVVVGRLNGPTLRFRHNSIAVGVIDA